MRMPLTLWIASALAFGPGVAHSSLAADFTGHWSGTGTLTQKGLFSGTQTSPCSSIDITLEHLPTKLTVRHYHAICGMVDSDWGPHVLEIRGTKVYEDDEETGTLEGDTLLSLQSDGGVQYAFNLRLKSPAVGQKAVLESYYGVRNMAGTLVIEGALNPASR